MLRLPGHTEGATVVAAVAERGVAVAGLAAFSVAGASPAPGAIVVNYAQPYAHEYRAALDLLVTALADAVG